jgi:hypothetical protein
MASEQAVERAEINIGDRVRERQGWAFYRVVALSRNGQVAYVQGLVEGTYSIEVENLVPLEAGDGSA